MLKFSRTKLAPGLVRGVPIGVVVTFIGCILIGNFGICLPWTDRILITPWTEANASAAAVVASALGQPTYVNGSVLTSAGGRMSVKKGCNGVEAFVILGSAILASPVPLTRRLVGVLFGAVAVFGLNIVRLVNLLFVLVHWPGQLDLFHMYIWQTLIILLSFGVFMVWGSLLAGKR